MSIYNWIQKIFFDTYEEWHMKSPIYDRNGFNIIGIDNSLKAIQDGYIMYTEITPSSAVKGCTSMKAIVGKNKEVVDLYLIINDIKYIISDLGYTDAIKIMREFVKKEILPDKNKYTLVTENDDEIIKSSFEELSKLLLIDFKVVQSFLKNVKHESMEDMETAWEELYEELLRKGRAIELDWKERKDDFIYTINKLSVVLNLCVDENALNDEEDIPRWGRIINSQWRDHVLAAMDVGSDSYVIMILSMNDFTRAKELARAILQRIALLEEM